MFNVMVSPVLFSWMAAIGFCNHSINFKNNSTKNYNVRPTCTRTQQSANWVSVAADAKSLCVQLLLQIIGHADCYGARAAHTASLSSGCRNSRFTPEFCLQVTGRKKNTAFHCKAYYSEGDSSHHLVLSRKETLQSDRGAAVIIGRLQYCLALFKVFLCRFLFALFLPLAWMKRHDVWFFSLFLSFSAWCRLFVAVELWSNCLSFSSDFLLQNNWATTKNKHCWAPNYKIITSSDQSEKQRAMQTPCVAT